MHQGRSELVGPLLDETLEACVLRSKLTAAGLVTAGLPANVAELDAGAVVLVTQRIPTTRCTTP